MRHSFSEYNLLSEETLKKLWDNALFVFDSNILLNLYRYSDETSKKFLEILFELKERIWLPYQIGLEFYKNRLIVISDQKKHYQTFEGKIKDIIGEIENKNRNPFFSEIFFNKIVSLKVDLKKEVDKKIEAYEEQLKNDPLLDKINSVFDKKIGSDFNPDELKRLYNDGEKRYKDKIPPGYCDIKKPENERYGDFIIWKQIMLKSKDTKVDIIFILDDRKEDWWLVHQGKTISPRPELVKEFNVETNKNCHFYKPFQFLEYSNEYLEKTIKVEVIEEVKNYKSETIESEKENFIQINLTLQAKIKDLNLLLIRMKSAGYNIYTEIDSINELHEVYITLPNIPDLERRLNAKYLSHLEDFNINLISSTKK